MTSAGGARAARGAGLLVLQGLAANVASIVYFAFVARLLTVSDYGALSAIGILVTMFFVAFSFIQPVAGTRFISSLLATGQKDGAKGLFFRVFAYATLTGAVASAMAYFAAPTLVITLVGESSFVHTMQLAALDVFFLIVGQFLIGLTTGLQDFRTVAIAGVCSSLLRSLGSIVALLLGFWVDGVVVVWVLSDFFNVALLAFVGLRYFGGTASKAQPLRQLFSYSLPLYLSSLTGYLQSNLDRYILVGLAGTVSLGIYSPAVSAVGIISGVLSSISTALFPHISGTYDSHGSVPMASALTLASRYILYIYVPMAFAVASLAYPTISLFVGAKYIDGAPVLAVLSLVSILNAFVLPATIVILATGRTRINLEASLLAVVTSLVLSLMLVVPLQSLGAALARAGLTIVSTAFIAYATSRIMPLTYDRRSLKLSVAASAVMAACLIGLQLFYSNKYLLPAYVVVGFFVYALSLRAMRAVALEDFDLLESALSPRLRPLTYWAKRLVVGKKPDSQLINS